MSPWRTLAECYLASGEDAKALVTVDAMGQLWPDDAELGMARADILLRAKEPTRALAVHNTLGENISSGSIDVDSDTRQQLWLGKARACMALSKHQMAETAYKGALQLEVPSCYAAATLSHCVGLM